MSDFTDDAELETFVVFLFCSINVKYIFISVENNITIYNKMDLSARRIAPHKKLIVNYYVAFINFVGSLLQPTKVRRVRFFRN